MQITDAKVIAGRLSKVRDIMKSEGVDIYVVVTGDYHISEYAGDYFKEREFITGFTGSAGTAVITQDDARLFTDGRYFVQAEKQIEGTGFSLMRVGAPGVMNVAQYCESIVKDGMSMGFDGRTMPAEEGIELSDICKKAGAGCLYDFDAIENIYEGRAAFPHSKADLVRFPGGSSNTISKTYCYGIMSQLVCAVEERGFRYCDWNVSSGDAGGTTSTSQVVANVIAGIKSNNVSVVLQHDIKNFSVDAVEQIIQWGLSEGYTFLPMTSTTPMSHHGVNN